MENRGELSHLWCSAITVAAILLLLSLCITRSDGQTDCQAPSAVLTTDAEIFRQIRSDCTRIIGDLVFGHQNCSSPCTLTSLARLSNVKTIEGSVTIQCCHSFSSVPLFPAVTRFTGCLRVYYNRELTTLSGFGQLQSMGGSIEVSQNPKLTSVSAFSSLSTLAGYLAIQYNPVLTSLAGFSQLSSIEGQQVVSGHALVLLFNTNLTSLASLSRLQTILYGTVHIEGNTALCYAGYPTWSLNTYLPRLDDSVSGSDQGIDWRSKLSQSEEWQYTWGVAGGGYPTLYIQNNVPEGSCGDASCHSSCPMNSGCLGPSNPGLCGTCAMIGSLDTCASRTPTSEPTSSPSGGGSAGIIVGIVIVVIVVVVALVALGIILLVVLRKKFQKDKTGSFDIHSFSSEAKMTNSNGENAFHSSQTSSLIAPSRRDSNNVISGKPNPGNVVTISNYKTSDDFDVEDGEQRVITNKNALSTPSPRTISRKTAPKMAIKKETLDKGHSLQEDIQYRHSNAPDLGNSNGALEKQDSPEETSFTEDSKPDPHRRQSGDINPDQYSKQSNGDVNPDQYRRQSNGDIELNPHRRQSSGDIMDRLKHGSEIDTNFPKNQVKLGKLIGLGDFGRVLQAEARKLVPGHKKTSVVVKQLKATATKEEKEEFLRPVDAMKLLKHPNVLLLMGVVTNGPNILVMLEDCSHGNLKTFLVSRRREAENFKNGGQLLRMAKDLAAGLDYLHSMSIAHNDLAVRNCLVTKEGVVKLGDYGISRELFKEDYYCRQPGHKAWPIRWMAPEQVVYQDRSVLDSNPVTMSANIWSFGITLWELCSFAQWPYDEMSNEEVIQMVIRTARCSLECPFEAGEKVVFLYACCQLCWQDDSNRPTIEEIISMLNEPSTITNKRRKSSLTRQNLILPQSRSKTLPASSMPAMPLTQGNSTIAQQVPLSDSKPTAASVENGSQLPAAAPVITSKPTPAQPPTLPGSNKTSPHSNDKSDPSSSDNPTGTLRKPKRPAPVKPPQAKVSPEYKDASKELEEQTVTKRSQPVAGQKEPGKRHSQPAPKRPAPVRSAPQHLGVAALKKDEEKNSSREGGSNKTKSSAKVKRVHSYRSNRKSLEIVTRQGDKSKPAAQDRNKTSSITKQTSTSSTNQIPSAQNFGFIQPDVAVEDKPNVQAEDFFDSDIDETYFLGGAESVPQEDFILDPPEHFSESSIGELEEEPTAKDSKQNTAAEDEMKSKTVVKSGDAGGMKIEFRPPQSSDDDNIEIKAEAPKHEESTEGKLKEMAAAANDGDEETRRVRKAKKKKKNRASRDLSLEEEGTKVRSKKKKKKASKQLLEHQDEQQEEPEVEEAQLPEYLHDRGLDRVPLRPSQDGSAPYSNYATNSLASYRSNESLDNGEMYGARKRHKSYYGDVNANDEFTPPWLEDDNPNEAGNDDDPYPGEDEPPQVVYDEEVSSLLW